MSNRMKVSEMSVVNKYKYKVRPAVTPAGCFYKAKITRQQHFHLERLLADIENKEILVDIELRQQKTGLCTANTQQLQLCQFQLELIGSPQRRKLQRATQR